MPKLTLNDQIYHCSDTETVLDTLLNNNIEVPYSCKQGSCHSCLMKSVNGMPPADAQSGLKDTQRLQKMFLACRCIPEADMQVALIDDHELFTPASVESIIHLNNETVRLVLKCHESIDYFAGQFVNLKRDDGLVRSYSLANPTSQGNLLEFHIRQLEGGKFSQWACNELKVGDELLVQGGLGDCFYIPEQLEQNLLLIGTGTGLAPLLGITLEALEKGHSGDIYLFHGSREVDDLYSVADMHTLAQRYPNLHYTPCLSGATVPSGYGAGRAHQVAVDALPDLKGWRVYLCGHPEMVNEAKRNAFLAGASMQQIYADPFVVNHAA